MTRRLSLDDLYARAPAVTQIMAAFYKENCMVCFDCQNHPNGLHLTLTIGETRHDVEVCWDGTVTDKMRVSYGDRTKRVDFGACAIALLVMPEFTGYEAVEPSAKGNGIDYFLTESGDDELIFNHSAHLEVSGIEEERGSNTIAARVASKRRRLRKFREVEKAEAISDLPTFICIVEFSQPQSMVVTA